MRSIISKDLKDRNIPEAILNSISPSPVKALYMREESTQPENAIVEIWSLDDNTFAMFEGDFDGNWDADNVKLVGQYPNIDRAKFAATATYTFKNYDNGLDYTGDDLVDGQKTAQRLKRLLKNN